MDKIEIINITKEFAKVVRGSFRDVFLDSESKFNRVDDQDES